MADKTITVTSVLMSAQGNAIQGVAAAAITEGQSLYQDPTTLLYGLADANGVAPANTFAGIALNRAGTGQRLLICTKDPAFQPGYTVAAGETVILSGTPGATGDDADAVTGWTKIIIGVGIGSNKIALDPSSGRSSPVADVFDHKIAAGYIDNGTVHRVLGVRLRPFSLWHLMLLQVLDSPFIHKGSVELKHLKVAVAVCRLGYRESRLRKPIWPIKLKQRALRKQVEAFLDYVGDYLSEPEYTVVPHGTGFTSLSNPPPRAVQAAFDAAHGANCPVGWAWEMPIGEAYLCQAMHLRNQGADLDFVDDAERAEQAKLPPEFRRAA